MFSASCIYHVITAKFIIIVCNCVHYLELYQTPLAIARIIANKYIIICIHQVILIIVLHQIIIEIRHGFGPASKPLTAKYHVSAKFSLKKSPSGFSQRALRVGCTALSTILVV